MSALLALQQLHRYLQYFSTDSMYTTGRPRRGVSRARPLLSAARNIFLEILPNLCKAPAAESFIWLASATP